MHACLGIPEIFKIVCDSFHTKEQIQACARLARTCKSFHKTAVDVLWSEIRDLVPLVKLFPLDSWRIDGHAFVFTRPITWADWNRVLKYSTRVRRIGVGPRTRRPAFQDKLPAEVIQTLCASRPQLAIFPLLRKLRWLGLDLAAEMIIPMLTMAGPGLECLDLQAWGSVSPMIHPQLPLALFAQVITQFPRLRSLNLSCLPTIINVPLQQQLSVLVSTLSSLTHFDCCGLSLTEDAIITLSRLPSLVDLSLRLPDPHAWTPTIPDSCPFPKLENLTIASTVGAYVAFSHAVTCCAVTAFEIRCISLPSEDKIAALFTAIHRQFHVNNLQSVSIVDHQKDGLPSLEERSRVGSTLRSAHLEPLFAFRELSYIDINPRWTYALDNALFDRLARAYPKLDYLHVAHDADCRRPEDAYWVSFTALASLAAHCPGLTELSLQFNAYGSCVPENLFREFRHGYSSCMLSSLKVMQSPIDKPEIVTKTLSRLFPYLSDVVYAGPAPAGQYYDKYWAIVQQFLPILADVREEERKRPCFSEEEDEQSESDSE